MNGAGTGSTSYIWMYKLTPRFSQSKRFRFFPHSRYVLFSASWLYTSNKSLYLLHLFIWFFVCKRVKFGWKMIVLYWTSVHSNEHSTTSVCNIIFSGFCCVKLHSSRFFIPPVYSFNFLYSAEADMLWCGPVTCFCIQKRITLCLTDSFLYAHCQCYQWTWTASISHFRFLHLFWY